MDLRRKSPCDRSDRDCPDIAFYGFHHPGPGRRFPEPPWE